MTLLSDSEMAQVRADAEASMVDSCTILDRSTENSAGDQVETYTPRGTPTPCRIAPIRSRQGGMGGGDRIDEGSTHVITLPVATAITTRDRIDHEGTVYAVTELPTYGELDATRRAEARPV